MTEGKTSSDGEKCMICGKTMWDGVQRIKFPVVARPVIQRPATNKAYYIAYAPTRTELAAQAICDDLDIPCIVPRKVEAIRQGKRRWPDAVISAAWPNYAFLTLTDAQWHQLHQLRKPPFRGTFMLVGPREWAGILPIIARVEQDFLFRMERIETGKRIAEYNPGDVLTMIGGPFANQMLRFKEMVEAAHEVFPQIKATMDMMGREVEVLIDPIYARRAAE